jgi:hypothetical protein
MMVTTTTIKVFKLNPGIRKAFAATLSRQLPGRSKKSGLIYQNDEPCAI